MKVLVVDDSSAMRMILRRMLESMGLEVLEAPDGLHGLEQLSKGLKPDIVLVDWAMPEMNGYDFLVAVRAKPELDDLKLVMVTSESQPESVMKALSAGADEYLIKPFTREAIQDKFALLGLTVA